MTTLAVRTPTKKDGSIPAAPDHAAIKLRQQATWASGDFAVIGVTLYSRDRPHDKDTTII